MKVLQESFYQCLEDVADGMVECGIEKSRAQAFLKEYTEIDISEFYKTRFFLPSDENVSTWTDLWVYMYYIITQKTVMEAFSKNILNFPFVKCELSPLVQMIRKYLSDFGIRADLIENAREKDWTLPSLGKDPVQNYLKCNLFTEVKTPLARYIPQHVLQTPLPKITDLAPIEDVFIPCPMEGKPSSLAKEMVKRGLSLSAAKRFLQTHSYQDLTEYHVDRYYAEQIQKTEIDLWLEFYWKSTCLQLLQVVHYDTPSLIVIKKKRVKMYYTMLFLYGFSKRAIDAILSPFYLATDLCELTDSPEKMACIHLGLTFPVPFLKHIQC